MSSHTAMRGSQRGPRRPYGTRPYGARGRGHSWAKSPPPRPRSASPPSGDLIEDLNVEDLRPSREDIACAHATELQTVSSYNWMNRETPTIMVPGRPPRWTPMQTHRQLKQDEGQFFRDENAARFPKHPMKPAVCAVFEEQPYFDGDEVDVFACGSTLGNLLRVVRKIPVKFRFLVEIVEGTAFFVRRENSPTSVIDGVYGFGHNFLEASTTWDRVVRGSESHQTIARYRFGNLTLLVRYEVDGYLHAHSGSLDVSSRSLGGKEMPEIQDQLSGLLTDQSSKAEGELEIVRGGDKLPAAALFDLKTRSFRKKNQDIRGEQLPRLWVRQLPNFVLGYHDNGVFDDVKVEDMRDRINTWEVDNQETLAKYSALLQKVVVLAKAADGQKLEVRGTEDGTLEFRHLLDRTWNALPDDLRARWSREQGSERSASDTRSDLGTSPFGYDKEGYDSPGSSDDGEKDYTACSAEDCGYCGRCSY